MFIETLFKHIIPMDRTTSCALKYCAFATNDLDTHSDLSEPILFVLVTDSYDVTISKISKITLKNKESKLLVINCKKINRYSQWLDTTMSSFMINANIGIMGSLKVEEELNIYDLFIFSDVLRFFRFDKSICEARVYSYPNPEEHKVRCAVINTLRITGHEMSSQNVAFFVVHHADVDVEKYVPFRNNVKKLTLFGVHGAPVITADDRIGIIREDDLPISVPSLQVNRWKEASALYHVFHNLDTVLKAGEKYVGFGQYDMTYYPTMFDSLALDVIYYLDRYPYGVFNGAQKIVTKRIGRFPPAIDMYNSLFGISMKEHDVKFSIQPLMNTFIVHVDVFKRLMAFLTSAYLVPHLSDEDMKTVNDNFDSMGHMCEALTGCFFSLEIRRGILKPIIMHAVNSCDLKKEPLH